MTDASATRIFEQPSISRQWVVRRLQRALTIDLAAAGLQTGVAGGARRADREALRQAAAATQARTVVVREVIEALGSVPYSSIGLSQALARMGGRVLGWCGAWAWRPALRLLARHTLSEYDVLVAFVDGAPGVATETVERIQPLLRSAREQYGALIA